MLSASAFEQYTSIPEMKEPLMGQNYMCIVYHDKTLAEHHKKDLRLYTEQLFYYPRFFDNMLSFSTYIRDSFIVKRIVFILTGSFVGSLTGVVKTRKQPPSDPLIYEMQFGKGKIQSDLDADRRFLCIDRLFETIRGDLSAILANEDSIDLKLTDKDEKTQHLTLPIGILDPQMAQKSFCFLSRDALKFHLFQSFIRLILNLNISSQDITKMWVKCRRESNKQSKTLYLNKIDEFKDQYDEANALRFYTEDTFLFRYVNKALRRENVMQVFDFRPLITHIHQQLSNLCAAQNANQRLDLNAVYRGKKLPKSVLQKLRDSIDHLISMNGFLSTTKSRDVSKVFADDLNPRMGYETVIFEMHWDPLHMKKTIETQLPFAYIAEKSHIPDDDEVLFFMGVIWRIKSVVQTFDKTWKVLLELSSNDQDQPMKKPDECNYFTLAQILHELGEYTNAIHYYNRMLESVSILPLKERIDLHCHYAKSAWMIDSNKDALKHLDEAEKLMDEMKNSSETTLVSSSGDHGVENDQHSSMSIATSRGLIYQHMDEYEIATKQFLQALEKPGTPQQKANLWFYIAVLETELGDYVNALQSYRQAENLAQAAGDETLMTQIQQKIKDAPQTVV